MGALCGSPRKGGKPPCRRPAGWGTAHLGTGRCKLHGGNARAGPAHPGYRHGLRSNRRFVPARWREEYERLRSDEELLSLQDQIRAAEAMELELRTQLDGQEPVSAAAVREHWQRFLAAVDAGDAAAVQAARGAIEGLLEPACALERMLRKLIEVQQHLARLKATEQRLVALKAEVVRVQDVHWLVHQMVNRLTAVVSDPLLLQRVLDGWEALFQAPERPLLRPMATRRGDARHGD